MADEWPEGAAEVMAADALSGLNRFCLPWLVVREIYERLSLEEIKSLRLASDWWKTILDQDRPFLVRAKVTKSSESQNFFLSTTLDPIDTLEFESGATLEIGDQLFEPPQIQNAVFGSSLSETIFETVFGIWSQSFQSVTILQGAFDQICPQKFPELFFVDPIGWVKLTELNLHVDISESSRTRTWTSQHLECCIQLLKLAKLPNVKTIGFHLSHEFGYSEPIKPPVHRLHRQFFEFLFNHAQSLTALRYSFHSQIPHELLDVRELQFPKTLTLLKITDVSISTGNPTLYQISIGWLVDHLRSLVRLKLVVTGLPTPWNRHPTHDHTNTLTDIFRKHGKTLEECHLDFKNGLDLSFLQSCHCEALKSLSLSSDSASACCWYNWGPGPTLTVVNKLVLIPNLKTLHLHSAQCFHHLVRKNAQTIETLKITGRNFDFDWNVLSGCNSLKTLCIDSDMCYIRYQLQPFVLANLIEFEAEFTDPKDTFGSVSWISRRMPNLYTGHFQGLTIGLPEIGVLQTMTNLKRVTFSRHEAGVPEYCAAQEDLTLTATSKTPQELESLQHQSSFNFQISFKH